MVYWLTPRRRGLDLASVGEGPIVRARCCVCGAPIRDVRMRKSVIAATQLRAYCEQHLPVNVEYGNGGLPKTDE